MHATIESPDQPDVIRLIADLDGYQDSLYPAESRYALDLSSLKKSDVRFVVARDNEGQAVGCGAIVLYDGYGELKRMYVREQSRGKGVAGKVLEVLEASAGEAGCTMFKLETGPSAVRAVWRLQGRSAERIYAEGAIRLVNGVPAFAGTTW